MNLATKKFEDWDVKIWIFYFEWKFALGNYHIFIDDGVDSGDISAFSSDHIKQRNVTYPRQCKMAATKVGDKCARTAPHAATAAVTRRLRCVPFPDVVGMEYR